MTNEEKKAIEFTERLSDDYKNQVKAIEENDWDCYDEEKELCQFRSEQFDIVLNLIENTQKEIEYWKDKFDKELDDNIEKTTKIMKKDNRINELEKAVKKRDKIIDEMVDYMITGLDDTAFNIICKKRNCSYKFYDNRKTSRRDCENCIKKYFEKKEG